MHMHTPAQEAEADMAHPMHILCEDEVVVGAAVRVGHAKLFDAQVEVELEGVGLQPGAYPAGFRQGQQGGGGGGNRADAHVEVDRGDGRGQA